LGAAVPSTLFPQHIIAKKRDGRALSRDEIAAFVRGATDGAWADYQLSAMLMAIFLRGMSTDETTTLTDAMMRSGVVVDLSAVRWPKVDKHSTGGVGDKISLHLAPMVAACGVAVPMVSGRGLGHTGGTLDKLEAIPGFRVNLSLDDYHRQLGKIGLVLTGQTAQFVPADKKLYALRDVTATVECLPLICASIMAKKLAEGIDALVLDVKCRPGRIFTRKESGARTRGNDGRDRAHDGQADPGGADRHGPAARSHGGQRTRGGGVHRLFARAWSGGCHGGHLCLGRTDAAAGGRGGAAGGGEEKSREEPSRVVRPSINFVSWSLRKVEIRAWRTNPGVFCPGQNIAPN